MLYFETSWTPVDELDSALGLDGSNGSVDILGDNITTVQHAASHVLSVTRIALDHLVGRLEASVGNFSNGQLLMVSLLSRNDWSVGDEGEMDTRIGDQVGLEFSQVDVQSTIKTERGSDGRNDLTNQSVQVGVGRAFNVQVAATDVIDSLVVDHESAVGMFKGGMGSQDGVVWLYNGSGDLGGRVDGKFQFRFLAVVNRKTFHQQRGESGTSTSTERVEDEKSLKASALIGQLADAIQHKVDDFLANGVVTTSVVVGGVFLTGDQLLRVKQRAVGASTDLIDDGGFQVDKDSTGNMLARA